jgi:drug/metabolite transporter (DMT)-like permease
MNNISLLIGSELALSLYPQLIKLVPATIEIQVIVRFITYAILALIALPSFSSFSSFNSINTLKEIKTIPIISTILMGGVNILHVASSYYSFKVLSSGFSYSLFYTYPIFNLLGRSIFNKETISPINYLYIIIAIIGVYLIYYKQNTQHNLDTEKNSTLDNNEDYSDYTKGLFAGIGSAITESLIYFMVKNDIPTVSPFVQIIKTYLLGGVLSLIYLGKKIFYDNPDNADTLEYKSLDWNDWITLILFNALIGFIGYVLRFYLIPKITTLKFNSLIFIGVVFAYIWGYLLSNEKIYLENILGTGLILFSIFMMNK